MSRAVWRFPLEHDRTAIALSVGATVLCVRRAGDGVLSLYAEIQPEPGVPVETRVFLIVATGHAIPQGPTGSTGGCKYVGTFDDFGGRPIFHVYEEPLSWFA